ncbi:unnamed protein product [Rhizophagus irregularis]|nr:unnamed protein product [Rhizophagus irregularis]
MDSTNLLIRNNNNNNNNNAIFQTVFDLLFSIIIPIVLCINVERSKRKRMQELKQLKMEVENLRGTSLAALHNEEEEEEGGQGIQCHQLFFIYGITHCQCYIFYSFFTYQYLCSMCF